MSFIRFVASGVARLTACAPRAGQREGYLIALVSGCIVAMIVASAVIVLDQNDRLARGGAEKRAERLAKTAAYELDTTLTVIDRAMRYTGAEIRKTENPERLAELGASGQLPLHLLRELVFVAPDGHILTSAMASDVARRHVDLSERPNFRILRDRTSDDNLIFEPIQSIGNNDLLLPVGRTVRHADGRLVGVMFALVDTTQLEQIWLDIGLGPHDTIDLLGSDGKLWLRWPNAKASGGSEQTFAGADSDQVESVRHLAAWPVTISLKIAGQALTAETAPARKVIVAVAFAGALLVISFSILLIARTRQVVQEHAAADLIRAHLAATIDALPFELLEFDGEHRLITANRIARQSQRWTGIPVGKTDRVLLEETIASIRAAHPERDWDGWIGRRLADMETGGTFDLSRGDGTHGRFFVRQMPDGGRLVARVDISELKQRERQLAAERARLKETIDALPVELLELDSDDRLTMANRAAREARGWIGDAIGKTERALYEESARAFRSQYPDANWDDWVDQRLAECGEGGAFDHPRPDGTHGRYFVNRVAGGGRLVVRVDVTELKQREEQLAAEQVRMIAALNAVPFEFVEYDRNRRVVMANNAARAASPWRIPGSTTGKTLADIMASDVEHFQTADTAQAWKTWAEQMVADFDRGGVAEIRRPDGKWRHSIVSDMPGGGRVVVRIDIGEQKRREAQLATEMEQFKAVFQAGGAGILMLDREARIIQANQFVLSAHGATAEEVIGLPYSELNKNGLDPAVIERWQKWTGAGHLATVEYEINIAHANGGKRVRKVTANPIQDESGRLKYIVIIGVDDTERRQAEIRMFDSSRLATLGEMATGMAHEFNQPLAVIRMAADSLIDELDTPEAASMNAELMELVRSKLTRISTQTERASSLVDKLRAVARKPSSEAQPFDVVAAARTSGDLLREQLKVARIAFTLDLPSSKLMVQGEAGRLQQVILNIVLNARDALRDDPSRPSIGTLGYVALRVSTSSAGGAVLTVEDDGPGIPAHVLPRLFEPFFTTKPTGKGTGLGLSISYDIVTRMGGEITAENRPGGGARFQIVLPPLHQGQVQTAA